MSETLLTVVGVEALIGGPFLLLWMLDRRRQAQGVQPEKPAGRRLLGILGILAAGVVLIVGVFYACTWVMVAQPTVGKVSLTTVVVTVVIIGGFILVIARYSRLLAEVISFISRIIGKE